VNGVVTLSGRVRTAAERDRAVAVARQTTGVSDVRSELAVQP
jgi:osmotically-inducible protein OsmY